MEITVRDVMTVVHGMFVGALRLLALSGVAVALYATASPDQSMAAHPCSESNPHRLDMHRGSRVGRLLMSSATTTGWHVLGMEWKERIAWFAPLCLTMVAFLFARYGTRQHALASLRRAVFAPGPAAGPDRSWNSGDSIGW